MDKVMRKNLVFVGIGAPRCGTTWVFECLNEHPEIFLPSIKETSFFSRNKHYKRGVEWYRTYFKDAPENAVLGEFSTEYLTHPEVIERLLAINPNIKILVCLRNPIDRCSSHYLYSRQTSLRGKSLRYAIETGHYAVGCSFYYRHLRAFFEHIPPENIHVSIMEEGMRDPKRYIQTIYKFLGVNETFVPESLTKKINTNDQLNFKFPIIHRVYMYRLTLRDYWWWEFFVNVCDRLRLSHVMYKISLWNHSRNSKTNQELPVLSTEDRKLLHTMFYDDVKALSKLLRRDLSIWGMDTEKFRN